MVVTDLGSVAIPADNTACQIIKLLSKTKTKKKYIRFPKKTTHTEKPLTIQKEKRKTYADLSY